MKNKSTSRSFLLFLLLMMASVACSQAERIGPFVLGLDQYLVEGNFGRGATVTFGQFELVHVYGTKDGNAVSVTYDRAGDPRQSFVDGVLLMRQKDLPRSKSSLSSLAPMATRRGIKIGDGKKKVLAAYGDSCGRETLSKANVDDLHLPPSFQGAEVWSYNVWGDEDGVARYTKFYIKNGEIIAIELYDEGC